MENNTLTVDNIEKIKLDFESSKIVESDLNKDQAILLGVLYELELIELEEKIENLKIEIEDYKNRMRKAIEYLKRKKK